MTEESCPNFSAYLLKFLEPLNANAFKNHCQLAQLVVKDGIKKFGAIKMRCFFEIWGSFDEEWMEFLALDWWKIRKEIDAPWLFWLFWRSYSPHQVWKSNSQGWGEMCDFKHASHSRFETALPRSFSSPILVPCALRFCKDNIEGLMKNINWGMTLFPVSYFIKDVLEYSVVGAMFSRDRP